MEEELVPWTSAWLREYQRRQPNGRASHKSLYDLQKGRCPWCGLALYRSEMSIEHIIPKSKGAEMRTASSAESPQ